MKEERKKYFQGKAIEIDSELLSYEHRNNKAVKVDGIKALYSRSGRQGISKDSDAVRRLRKEAADKRKAAKEKEH